jgi:hypothetical protein
MAKKKVYRHSSNESRIVAYPVYFEKAWSATMLRPYRQPMVIVTVEWKPGLQRHLAFSQYDATRLINSISGCLRDQGSSIGIKVLNAISAQCRESKASAQPLPPKLTGRSVRLDSPEAPRKARQTDMLVSLKALSQLQKSIWKRGVAAAIDDLLEIEPGVARYLDYCVGWIFQQLRDASVDLGIVDAVQDDALLMAMTIVAGLRIAHFRLWKDTMIGTRLAQIDPQLLRRKPKRDK